MDGMRVMVVSYPRGGWERTQTSGRHAAPTAPGDDAGSGHGLVSRLSEATGLNRGPNVVVRDYSVLTGTGRASHVGTRVRMVGAPAVPWRHNQRTGVRMGGHQPRRTPN